MNGCNHEQLLLLAAGELDARLAPAVREHLAGCPACAEDLARLREAMRCLDRLPVLEPSGDALRRMHAAGRKASRRYRFIRPNFARRYRFALSAAAALTLLLSWTVVKDILTPRVVYSPAELRRLWAEPSARVIESGAMVSDLAELQATDEWSRASDTLVANLGRSDVTGELLDIEESLGCLEDQVNDAAQRLRRAVQ